MKCPRCGSEMVLDSHRKIPLNMCYECGYIEGRTYDGEKGRITNFDHLKNLNLNEAAAFLTSALQEKGVNIDEAALTDWLVETKN